MSQSPFAGLSKRERQIMEIVYERGQATAMEIASAIPDPPSSDSVRALIRILESKGRLKHIKDGVRHIYLPTRNPKTARRSALKRVVETFFGGSIEHTVSSLLDEPDTQLSEQQLSRLAELIEKKRKDLSK